MGYNKENYRRIREKYAGKYILAEKAAQERLDQLHCEIPELSNIDSRLAKTGLAVFAATIDNTDPAQREARLDEIRNENKRLQELRAELLASRGYPADYTDVHYECSLCGDTGVTEKGMCSCMRNELIMAGYESSGISELLKKQSFENFSLDYYKDSPKALAAAERNYNVMYKFAKDFSTAEVSDNSIKNVAMFGATGLGKTHLSTAVARCVIEKGYDVLYSTAVGLVSAFEFSRFGSGIDASGGFETDRYYDCDLLIIDDLGTEVSNQFTVSCLYNIINVRLNRGRSTVISTNLTTKEFRERYWDRITSRVFGEYVLLAFTGTDIRAQKLKQ